MPLPRFRNMDVIPIEEEGKPVFIIRDNEGLFDHTLRLPPMAFVVASLLDGVREIKGIQDTIAEQFEGTVVPEEELKTIVEDLDKNLLLESKRVSDKRNAIIEEFSRLPNRPSRFAGLSYAKEPDDLRKELSAFYDAAGGAGQPGTNTESNAGGRFRPSSPPTSISHGEESVTHTRTDRSVKEARQTFMSSSASPMSPLQTLSWSRQRGLKPPSAP